MTEHELQAATVQLEQDHPLVWAVSSSPELFETFRAHAQRRMERRGAILRAGDHAATYAIRRELAETITRLAPRYLRMLSVRP